MTRLTRAMLVSALCRRVQAEGGFAAILHRGDAQSGAILVECTDRGARQMLLERASGPDGRDSWRPTTPSDDGDAHQAMLERRRRSDPDLWVVELDIADAERFAAEIIDAG